MCPFGLGGHAWDVPEHGRTEVPTMTDVADEVSIRLSRQELELIRTALKLLLATLGREEADEITDIHTLLARTQILVA
jgi:hypothetical protein